MNDHPAPAPDAPDANDVAAWLDGRCDAATAARVERALADDPARLAALLAARSALHSLDPATRADVDRAALGTPSRAPARAAWWPRVLGAAAVAACVVVGVAIGRDAAQRQWERDVSIALRDGFLGATEEQR